MGKERWVLILAWRIDDKLVSASLVLKRADQHIRAQAAGQVGEGRVVRRSDWDGFWCGRSTNGNGSMHIETAFRESPRWIH